MHAPPNVKLPCENQSQLFPHCYEFIKYSLFFSCGKLCATFFVPLELLEGEFLDDKMSSDRKFLLFREYKILNNFISFSFFDFISEGYNIIACLRSEINSSRKVFTLHRGVTAFLYVKRKNIKSWFVRINKKVLRIDLKS